MPEGMNQNCPLVVDCCAVPSSEGEGEMTNRRDGN